MKYVKTYENFSSQINEEEEILKSIRKAFGRESEADLVPLKEKFDAELENMEKQILANMENPNSPIKVHLNILDEDEAEAKKETTFKGVVAPLSPEAYKSKDYQEKWGSKSYLQLLQVQYIQENGWFDYTTGKYSTPEEMKGKELEVCKNTWTAIKPKIQEKAKEIKYNGQFQKYSFWKLLFMSKKGAYPQEGLDKEGKVYLSISGELFDKTAEAKGTYASGGFHR